jgi:hypothetical protein
MISVAERRLPTLLMILFALVGIAVSVAIGRALAAGDASRSLSQSDNASWSE